MSHFNETVRALSQISDTGLFEHLAAAVLRGARPEIYSNLTQPGTNADGKPVKSPVDAISFVPNADPRHMVTAHHTTCKQGDLRRKWLHDPATVKTRSGKKSALPLGDLIKTAAIAKEERIKSPGLIVTLALTTNEEPPEEVTRDADRIASSHQVTLDIWSRSRIAEFLDNSPNGQWLRKRYLDIAQERLSFDLLRELGQKSLEAHQSPVRQKEQIPRAGAYTTIDSLPLPVGFLAGESGFGKSVACYQYLALHMAQGGCGLVLPHEQLATCTTLDQAIDAALRHLHPFLAEAAGSQARALCSADLPLLITVEDISRSGHSAQLIDRLVRWSESFKTIDQGSNWRLICPVWPELLSSLGDDTRKRIEPLTRRLITFTPEEARFAILKRAELENIELSGLDADSIADALGYDPLLIGLHDLKLGMPPTDVIATFVSGSAERVSRKGSYMANEHRVSLRALASRMLIQGQMAPKWGDVLSWFNNSPDELRSLREQVKHGEVIRLTNSHQEAQVAFRHDRVRKWLLADAAAYALKCDALGEEIFSDPYFADVIGAALADKLMPEIVAERARQSNPLALFYALQSFREPAAPGHDAVLKAIDGWLSDERSHSRSYQCLRYAALSVLSETQSSNVLKVLPKFKDNSWARDIAGLRNGDLASGVRLCASLEPGSEALWRDRAIEHTKLNFGAQLTKELEEILKYSQSSDKDTVGSLRLAGHLADTSLANAIEICWNYDPDRVNHLKEYLWAAAQCGGDQTEKLLSPVCEAWAALSDQPESEGMPSPRKALAADYVAWAFWRSLPEPALRFFIQRASSDDLRWPIVYMLHGMDHPDAVSFLAEYLADKSRELKGTDGFHLFPSTVTSHWHRWQRERGKPMSKQSRARLQELWANESHDKQLRKQSFRLWAATTSPSDILLLKSLKCMGELTDDVLRARLKRSDQTAIPDFIEKLRGDDDDGIWWYSARHIWSDALSAPLNEYLERQARSATPTWGASHQFEWIISELIMEQDASVLEDVLFRNWEFMRFSPNYVQAALYAATPRSLKMAKETIQECPTPDDMFKHIDMHFGIKTTGRAGVTRVEQIQALVPYLDHLSESSIHQFWEVCNERGWLELRRAHLDSRLGEWSKRVCLNDVDLSAELDEELKRDKHYWLDHWFDRHMDNGRSKEDIFRILEQWLCSNKNPKALQIASSVIIHAGSRADTTTLDNCDDKSALAAAIICDTRFAVQRRTLT